MATTMARAMSGFDPNPRYPGQTPCPAATPDQMPRLRTTALKDHPRPSSDVARTLWICTLATIGCSGDPAGPSVRTIGVTGTVRVRATTTGVDPDRDGYRVVVDDVETTLTVPSNGSVTVGGVSEGAHSISLTGVAENCAVADAARPVTISTRDEVVDVAFSVSCEELGAVHATVVTVGDPPDLDGYRITAHAAAGIRAAVDVVTADGAATIQGLAPGRFWISLEGVAGNCGGTGAQPQQVQVPSGGTAVATFAVTCGELTQLAYVGVAGPTSSDIYSVRSDGTNPTRLTNHPGIDQDPAWSPDATRIAFTSDRDGPLAIYIMDADGSNVRRLTSAPLPSSRPAWSPDGTRIAFVSRLNATRDDVYVIDADGANRLRLTTDPGADSDPAWSPDGTRIAFSSTRTGDGDVYVMNADGSNVTRLTTHGRWDGQPAWSPDGSKLAFAREECVTDWFSYSLCYHVITVADVSGGGQVQVGIGDDPQWSRDGSRIAVTGYDCNIYYFYDDSCTPSGVAFLAPYRVANGWYVATWGPRITAGPHFNPTWR